MVEAESPAMRAAEADKPEELSAKAEPSVDYLDSAYMKRSPSTRAAGAVIGIFSAPCQMYSWLTMMYADFGMYVPAAVLQYGLNQGIGMSMELMARKMFFKDVLKLDGATAGRYGAAAAIPWCIKPIFGMLSDAVPIWGYHRTSYLVLAGLCGVAAYTSLGLLPLAGIAVVPFFLLLNVSVAMPDVMIDASTAELSQKRPERASDLQSLSWGALSLGGLISCSSAGVLVEELGPKMLFLLTNLCSLGVLVPGLLRWLPERRLPRGERGIDLSWLKQNTPVTLLAAYMSVTSILLSVLQLTVDSPHIRGAVTLLSGLVLTVGIYTALRRVSKILAKTAIFIFVRECLQPGMGDVMFQWMVDAPEGPHFTPRILSWVDCFGSLGLLAGIVIYNKYLTNVPYRRIFLMAQVAMVLTNSFDIVLVKRWNLLVGIPDIVMLMGDEAFAFTMRRFFAMPMLILAAKVCPSNLEATLFAVLMALSNFGSRIGEFFGVTLLEFFGVVDGNYEHLADAVIAKSLCRLLPIVLIPLLVPNLRPTDPIAQDGEEEDAAATDGDATKESAAEKGGAVPGSEGSASTAASGSMATTAHSEGSDTMNAHAGVIPLGREFSPGADYDKVPVCSP